MSKPLVIRSDDRLVQQIPFKPYRYTAERQAVQFLPAQDEPQSMVITTPWGGELTVEKGDYIVNELHSPNNRWPVKKDIFEESYAEIRPGYYVKRAIVGLYPLWEVTKDPEQLVRIHTQEGVVTVRAGDYYLCRGIQGEVWPMPNERVRAALVPVDAEEI